MPNPRRMAPVLRAVQDARIPAEQLARVALQADRRLKRGLDTSAGDALYRLALATESLDDG